VVDGLVLALWRFPVAGMRGEGLRSSQIEPHGLAGDRRHHVCDPEGGVLTPHDVPRLEGWTASYPFNPDGAVYPDRPPPFPLIAGAGGRWRWGDPRLLAALSRDLRREVTLERDAERPRGVILSTVTPVDALDAAGINLGLELALPAGGWAGRELLFRDGVRLRLVASRADGPGIEARVVQAGRIVIGEPVTLS